MNFVSRGGGGDIENGFSGVGPERRPLRMQPVRPVNTNSLALLVTVLLLFTYLNTHQVSSNFLLWAVLGVFLIATSLRMYATCQQLQAQARAHAVASSGLFGHTELHFQMPTSIALASRGRLQGLRLQLALLDRDFDDLDYETLRALDSDNVQSTALMSEDEINALPVHKYKMARSESEDSQSHESSSTSLEANQDYRSTKDSEHDLTCSICLEQVKRGEFLRSLPCLHQFHVNCIDPWLRQQGTCPICKLRAGPDMQDDSDSAADIADMV